jgi:hypothetical protein
MSDLKQKSVYDQFTKRVRLIELALLIILTMDILNGLAEGLERTIKYEFIDKIMGQVFYAEQNFAANLGRFLVTINAFNTFSPCLFTVATSCGVLNHIDFA